MKLRKVYEYSHLGGSEILIVRYPEIDQEIDDVIEGTRGVRKTKESREKTKAGRMLYSPKDLNRRFKRAFRDRGYRELRDTYIIAIPNWTHEVRGAYKQIDFVKDRVLVEVQMGKYAFMFYDLVRLQVNIAIFHLTVCAGRCIM